MSDSNILKKHIRYWFNRIRNALRYAFESRLMQYDMSAVEWSI